MSNKLTDISINKDITVIKAHLEDGSTIEFVRKETLEEIKQHIKDKVRKSFEYDWGISGRWSDRLFSETVVELQVIENMIDNILEGKDVKA